MPTDEEIMNAGVEETQAAAEEVVTPEETTPVVEEAPEPPKTVPVAALEDERSKRQQAEQQLQQYQQLLMQQAAMRQAVNTPSPQQQQQDIMQQIGVRPDELYTEDGVRRFATGIQTVMSQKVEQEVQRIRAEMQQQQFSTQAQDYDELVGKDTPFGFQAAEPLKRALQEFPDLQNDLVAIKDQALQRKTAYRFAKMAKKIMDAEASAPNGRDISTQVNAVTAPMSPAAAGGGGAFTKARQVGQMSDEEFMRLDREAASTG